MTKDGIEALAGRKMFAGFKCWICGRFARLISVVAYPDEPGHNFRWQCRKCGVRSGGT